MTGATWGGGGGAGDLMGAAPRAGETHASRHRDRAKARVLTGGTRPACAGRLGRAYRQHLRCDNSGLISHPFNDALLRTHSIPLFCRREPPHQGRHNATRVLSLQKRVPTFVMKQSQASNQELSTIIQHPIINVQPGRSMLHIFSGRYPLSRRVIFGDNGGTGRPARTATGLPIL